MRQYYSSTAARLAGLARRVLRRPAADGTQALLGLLLLLSGVMLLRQRLQLQQLRRELRAAVDSNAGACAARSWLGWLMPPVSAGRTGLRAESPAHSRAQTQPVGTSGASVAPCHGCRLYAGRPS
jgi:hypothetical protein